MTTHKIYIKDKEIDSLHFIAPNYLYEYYYGLNMGPHYRKYGSIYEPRDNSWAIDIETGKHVSVLPVEYDESELNSTLTVVSKPYYDTVNNVLSHTISREFINVKSSKTGRIIRVLNY